MGWNKKRDDQMRWNKKRDDQMGWNKKRDDYMGWNKKRGRTRPAFKLKLISSNVPSAWKFSSFNPTGAILLLQDQ